MEYYGRKEIDWREVARRNREMLENLSWKYDDWPEDEENVDWQELAQRSRKRLLEELARRYNEGPEDDEDFNWQDISERNRIVTPVSNGWGHITERLTEEEKRRTARWCRDQFKGKDIRLIIFMDEAKDRNKLQTNYEGKSGIAFTSKGVYRWEKKKYCGGMLYDDIQTVVCREKSVLVTGRDGSELELPCSEEKKYYPRALRMFLLRMPNAEIWQQSPSSLR